MAALNMTLVIFLLCFCCMHYRHNRPEYNRRVLLEARKDPPAA